MTDKPEVLWLARMLPVPLNAGDRIYTAKLAGALAGAGVDVHYLGLANPEDPALDASALDPAVRWEVIPGAPIGTVRGMFSRRPMVGARFGTPAYAARIVELLRTESYAAIVVDQYGLAWTLPLIARHARGKPRLVHVAHDFETEVTQGIADAYRGNPVHRAALHLNARRTARAERELAKACDVIVTLTDRDRALFQQIGAGASFLILPPGYDGPRRSSRRLDAATPRRVAIVGSYRWTAKQINLTRFLEEADPILAAAGIDLAIVGDAPDDYRAQWKGRLGAGRFLGFVDDLAEFLDGCRMGLVIEAVGGGFKLKVLDYVFLRAPVAALAPALGGQSPDVTRHFLVRDDVSSLAQAIVALIDNLERLNAMQEASFAAAAPLYDWGSNGRQLAEALVPGFAAQQ